MKDHGVNVFKGVFMKKHFSKVLALVSTLSFAIAFPSISQAADNPTPQRKIDNNSLIAKNFERASASEASNWNCENNLLVRTAPGKDGGLILLVNKKMHVLHLISSLTGSQRFVDAQGSIEWLVIPEKAMLFDMKIGQRLVDYCKTPEMTKGAPPPTYDNS